MQNVERLARKRELLSRDFYCRFTQRRVRVAYEKVTAYPGSPPAVGSLSRPRCLMVDLSLCHLGCKYIGGNKEPE